MNERIEKLIDDAKLTAVSEVFEEDLKKFAELIVRDISKIIESQDVDPAFKHRMSWAVKDRYGVED